MDFINMLKIQADKINEELEGNLLESKYPEDVHIAHYSSFEKFNKRAFSYLSDKTPIGKLNSTTMTNLMSDINSDIHSLNSQATDISNKFANLYNANQDFKTKIKNRVNELISSVSDAQILMDEYERNSITYRDSLTGYSFIDQGLSVGNVCNIATSEGVSFLKIKSDTLINNESSSIIINKDSGDTNDSDSTNIKNCIAGNYNIAKIVAIKAENAYENYIDFESNIDPHDDLNDIIDNEANTWFEYQKLGIHESFKNMYDIDWANAVENGDNLTLDIIIKLHDRKKYDVNWINITPYLPNKSRANTKITKIRVSSDGASWDEIYSGVNEIHTVAQTHLSKDISNEKIISQGLYAFKSKSVSYIHFVFEQDVPYKETFAKTLYYKSDIDPSTNIDSDEWLSLNSTLVNPSELTKDVLDGPTGKYTIKDNNNNVKYIVKRNILIDGFRYAIGIRSIDLYKKEFEESSSFVTKKFTSDKPIKKITLSSNEFIPDEFSNYGIYLRNDWIRYYISTDDVNWYRISPTHHNPIGEAGLSANEDSYKIYEVNSQLSQEERNLYVNKGYIGSGKPIYGVRLKVVMTRPTDLVDLTPMLEEYSLRLDLEGEMN